jgi:hypothetical protein
VRDARREAFERLDGRYEVRVLEPSPPAVADAPWFADDPTARGEVDAGRTLVSPVPTGDVLWDDLAREDADLAEWCADRWMGSYRRLDAVPASLAETRLALHRLAETVMSPARAQATGKIALRYTHGGFGTPYFGDDRQMRVEGDELVVDGPEGERREPIEGVDASASRFLGDWYGFCASVLEQLRAELADQEPSRVQLWPEHFDLATELGSEEQGRRAGYGGSPGDELHEEPYLYVVPWQPECARGDLWTSPAFRGAELPFAALLEAGDQRALALKFFRARLDALTS